MESLAGLYAVIGVLSAVATIVAVWVWAVYERGIIIGGIFGAVIAWCLGCISFFAWPILAPVLWFNRKKVAYFVHISIENTKARTAGNAYAKR